MIKLVATLNDLKPLKLKVARYAFLECVVLACSSVLPSVFALALTVLHCSLFVKRTPRSSGYRPDCMHPSTCTRLYCTLSTDTPCVRDRHGV